MYQKICAYSLCQKPFSTPFKKQMCCSRPCGSAYRAVQTPEALKAYFWKHVEQNLQKNDCWPWKGSLNDQGYGMAFVKSGKVRAHRLSYELFVGVLAQEDELLHSQRCTTRACVNWHHLRIGTHQENIKDAVEMGTMKRGSRHFKARLTEGMVRKILRSFHLDGASISRMADEHGMSIQAIHDIIYRQTWTHVLPGQFPAPLHDGRATITQEIADTIREKYWNQHTTFEDLARAYGLTIGHARRICDNESWPSPSWPSPEALKAQPYHARNRAGKRSSMTEQKVEELLSLFHDHKWSQKALAHRFKLSRQTVNNILFRKTWEHVLPDQYPPPKLHTRHDAISPL